MGNTKKENIEEEKKEPGNDIDSSDIQIGFQKEYDVQKPFKTDLPIGRFGRHLKKVMEKRAKEGNLSSAEKSSEGLQFSSEKSNEGTPGFKRDR